MSCRTTSGGSASLSLARMASGLPDRDCQSLFHALKREGEGLPPPSETQLKEWRARQEGLVERARRAGQKRKDSLRKRLFRSRNEPVPDGSTFYAWSHIEARARQEAVIRSITNIVDLAPPGSQAAQYVLGEDGRPLDVMYASYGSNLHRDRFLTYIQGGTPAGSRRVYPGCTDSTEPDVDIPIRFSGGFRPYFALNSSVWHGGIAFLDHGEKETDGSALGRAYHLPIRTFDEVVHFENGGLKAAAAQPVPLDEVLATGRATIGPGAYETLLHIGDHNGMPVLTFTGPFSVNEALNNDGEIQRTKTLTVPVAIRKPSAAYCRMIGNGLQETFKISEVAAADYLRGMPGGERWSRADMVAVLREPEPLPEPDPLPDPAQSWRRYAVPATGGGNGSEDDAPHVLFSSSDLELKKWIEEQQAASGTPRRRTAKHATRPTKPAHTGHGTREPSPRLRTDTDGNPYLTPSRTANNKNEYLPGVLTYKTIPHKLDGVRLWDATAAHAQARLDAFEQTADTITTKGQREHARLQLILTEALHKRDQARNQNPSEYFQPADTYTANQWEKIKERTQDVYNTAMERVDDAKNAGDDIRYPTENAKQALTAATEAATKLETVRTGATPDPNKTRTSIEQAQQARTRAADRHTPKTRTTKQPPAHPNPTRR